MSNKDRKRRRKNARQKREEERIEDLISKAFKPPAPPQRDHFHSPRKKHYNRDKNTRYEENDG